MGGLGSTIRRRFGASPGAGSVGDGPQQPVPTRVSPTVTARLDPGGTEMSAQGAAGMTRRQGGTRRGNSRGPAGRHLRVTLQLDWTGLRSWFGGGLAVGRFYKSGVAEEVRLGTRSPGALPQGRLAGHRSPGIGRGAGASVRRGHTRLIGVLIGVWSTSARRSTGPLRCFPGAREYTRARETSGGPRA